MSLISLTLQKLISQVDRFMATFYPDVKLPPMDTPTPPAPPASPAPSQGFLSVPTFLWDTQANARHSVRVICDNMGLSLVKSILVNGILYAPKDIICACIMQESRFNNNAIGRNKNSAGVVTSTDWGICQINDWFHIGAGKDFPSIEYVLANPDKAVEFMCRMYAAGQLKLWVSYSSGAYKQWL